MTDYTPLTADEKAIHDALARKLTDEGRLIEAGFRSLCTMVLGPNTPQIQIDEMRRAFMAGAQHVFASVTSMLDSGDESTADDMRRMSLIYAELERFADEMRVLAAQPGDRASAEVLPVKPDYDINVPDQQRLKIARLEIESVLQKHDLAGVVVLHTPGMTEFFYQIRPTYSCAWIEEPDVLRVKSKLADYEGDTVRRALEIACTASMTRGLADELRHAATMFGSIAYVVDNRLQAEHTHGEHVPDPMELKKQ